MQRCFFKASKSEAYTKRRCMERQKDQEEISMALNSRKVAMVGCGFVGSASAFALMQSKLFSEMVLIDADQNRAEGEALDISHGMAFASPMKIYAGTYDDVSDAAIIVITAGANQKPEETRLDLIQKNAKIMRSIIGEIKKRDFEGILLIVSNPVDILTYIALKESGYPANRVIGSGTVLDTGMIDFSSRTIAEQILTTAIAMP